MRLLVQLLSILVIVSFTSSSDTDPTSESYTLINARNLVKPGCNSRCGELIVPYPFGIGFDSNCSIDPGFDIYCDTSLVPPKASIKKTSYTSIRSISDSTLRLSNLVAIECYYPNGTTNSSSIGISANYSNWPYTFSQVNKFTVIGCDDYAWLTSSTRSKKVFTGCMVFCNEQEDALVDECSGNGCCQSSIPKDITYYTTSINTLRSSGNVSASTFSRCTYAFVGEADAFKFNGARDLKDESFVNKTENSVPLVLEWAISNLTCAQAADTDGFACQSNTTCVSSTRETGGYRCICKQGYEGNPYLSPGCEDINECKDPAKYPCYGTCVNTVGNYTCKCKKGYYGNAKIKDGCRHKQPPMLLISLGTGLGFLAITLGLSIFHLLAKRRKLMKLREKFYKQNGGVLLEEKLKTMGRIGVGSMKIFGMKELQEASMNYAQDRILGKGGNGIVYKGTLSDKRDVAIKKSQKVDQGQREQFINEMVILTQINHQNVVQLLGFCLETDVPLLVYEFVSNNTLHHHIHPRTSGIMRLSWKNRLRIAHESASALSYLHTDARMSIIHRDVKSTNILLDENYTAKIADFGASRIVPLFDDQVTTLVQGTLGYLDPEYFHTGQLTDKSDVYSFGVVLAELLTGKAPLGVEKGVGDTTLATYFVKAKEENRLNEILEIQVVREATHNQLKETCDLVCECLNQVGGKRPSMKEVAMKLGTIRNFDIHPWVSQDNSNGMSSLMVENDLYTVPLIDSSGTFGECSSNGTQMNGMMLPIQNPR